ncbi:cyclin-G1-like [Ylistrum balloti]|uniref:cyclin-G1-like n=1 Tax=Ylistrum balloti TaxID=509963 RepID=UPI0029057F91|nr:cyclin-G1-like [Ylistrum balloti]XP_060065265.1 cyclin-G1-like [Ylistrum balloti]XP_060065266.1 cyclin-G1-like [Ylistrum balloti]
MVQEIFSLLTSQQELDNDNVSSETCIRTMTHPRKSANSPFTKALSDVVVLKQLLQRMEKDHQLKDWCGHLNKTMHASQRDSAVSTIRCLCMFYSCSCETFASAVNFLDRFLFKMKVQHKYISVIAAACFYISAKFNQEAEEIPSATEISHLHGQTWKPSDLKRMEMVILEKLNWEIWPVTCPSLLKPLCDIIMHYGHNCSILDSLLSKFEVCINYSSCAIFKSSTLALALLQHSVIEMNDQTFELNQCLLWLHTVCQVQDSEFYECFCTVSEILDLYKKQPQSHPSCLKVPKPQIRMSLISRPSYYGCTDLPTIEESYSDVDSSDNIEEVFEDMKISTQANRKLKSWSFELPEKCAMCDIH